MRAVVCRRIGDDNERTVSTGMVIAVRHPLIVASVTPWVTVATCVPADLIGLHAPFSRWADLSRRTPTCDDYAVG